MQPSADTDTKCINKGKYEMIDGVFDPQSEVIVVDIQPDEELAHDSEWTESDVSRRPRRNRKSPVWLHDYDQHYW